MERDLRGGAVYRAHPGQPVPGGVPVRRRPVGRTRQVPRPGNGPAAQPLPGRGAEAIVRAGRPDLIPGYDGTIRYAYRRMSGWRVSRVPLARAVHRYAPQVPVIDGPAYPPALTWSDGRALRRHSRGA